MVGSTRAVEETKEEEKADDSEEVENIDENDDNEEELSNSKYKQTGLVFSVYKSTRLKGYITLVLASGINYDSAKKSDDEILNNAQQATVSQRRYAMAVSLVTLILSLLIMLVHLDRYSPLKKCWEKAFQKQSKFELGLLLFLLIWTITATWIQTSVKGIAGDGKGQYNLYFSTWASLWVSAWTLERWMRFAGLASFSSFNASWPNRAPGWIMVFILSLATLLCYVDLYVHWDSDSTSETLRIQYADISQGQWSWLIIAATVTVPSSLAFVLVEIFRESRPTLQEAIDRRQRTQEQGSQVQQEQQQETSGGGGGGENGPKLQEKSEWENILEGFSLLILFLAWVPTLIIATSPGGAASLVGNAYFFTWATTVFVLETAVWWIHDWRKRIHTILQEQEEEYRRIQEEVLKKSQQTAVVGTAGVTRREEAPNGDNEQSGNDDDDDEFDDAEESEDAGDDDDDKYELYYE